MNYSNRAIIRALVAPNHILSCPKQVWYQGLRELYARGDGKRESGAFLLGNQQGKRRYIKRFVFYDDLDPVCLDSGIVVFDGTGYGPLWDICRDESLKVVADIHTHPGSPNQSWTDRQNPMIAQKGHIALIVPNFALQVVPASKLGIYEYLAGDQWINHSGFRANQYFYIGLWG